MRFEQHLSTVDSRPRAETGHARHSRVVHTMHAHREHATDGRYARPQPQIRRRIAEFAAKLRAAHNMPADAEATPEQMRRRIEIALRQHRANPRTRYALAIQCERRDFAGGKPVRLAHTFQQGEVARARMAEAKPLAHPYLLRVEPRDQHALDEFLRRHCRQLGVEAQQQYALDPGAKQARDFLARRS